MIELTVFNEEKGDHKVKKLLFAMLLVALLLGIAAVPAFAGGPGNNHASPCGATHGAFASVNGNFGWLGPLGGTPGYHGGAVGQEPGATGYNNSHVVQCGPQD